jgi:predicted metal-dependent phosphoesterase TrpH
MLLKTNLHMHTSDDPMDSIEYSIFEAIDRAARYDFDVLAITCHKRRAWKSEYAEYARERDLLLLSGIEINVDEQTGRLGRHVLIINAEQGAEDVQTFEDLAQYRERNPNSLIIAAHPYFYGNFSLHEFLIKYIHLFDAIEHSWFYSRHLNRNKQAITTANKHGLPLVATSDTHYLDFINENYTLVDAANKSEQALIEAIKLSHVHNVTSPRKLISQMIIPQGMFMAKNLFKIFSAKFW